MTKEIWTRHHSVYRYPIGMGGMSIFSRAEGGGPVPPTPTSGALDAPYTINANGDKVKFSRGFLCYQADDGTGQLTHATINGGTEKGRYTLLPDYNIPIELIHNALCDSESDTRIHAYIRPLSSGNVSNNKPWQDFTLNNHTFGGTNYDPAYYNEISGISDGEAGKWRTLTYNEWLYLLKSRTTTRGYRHMFCNYNGDLMGVIFPDNFDYTFEGNVSNWMNYTFGVVQDKSSSLLGQGYSLTDNDFNTIIEHKCAIFKTIVGGIEGRNIMTAIGQTWREYLDIYWVNTDTYAITQNGAYVRLTRDYNVSRPVIAYTEPAIEIPITFRVTDSYYRFMTFDSNGNVISNTNITSTQTLNISSDVYRIQVAAREGRVYCKCNGHYANVNSYVFLNTSGVERFDVSTVPCTMVNVHYDDDFSAQIYVEQLDSAGTGSISSITIEGSSSLGQSWNTRKVRFHRLDECVITYNGETYEGTDDVIIDVEMSGSYDVYVSPQQETGETLNVFMEDGTEITINRYDAEGSPMEEITLTGTESSTEEAYEVDIEGISGMDYTITNGYTYIGEEQSTGGYLTKEQISGEEGLGNCMTIIAGQPEPEPEGTNVIVEFDEGITPNLTLTTHDAEWNETIDVITENGIYNIDGYVHFSIEQNGSDVIISYQIEGEEEYQSRSHAYLEQEISQNTNYRIRVTGVKCDEPYISISGGNMHQIEVGGFVDEWGNYTQFNCKYTTDGSDPRTSSTAIVIPSGSDGWINTEYGNVTFKGYCYYDGCEDSSVFEDTVQHNYFNIYEEYDKVYFDTYNEGQLLIQYKASDEGEESYSEWMDINDIADMRFAGSMDVIAQFYQDGAVVQERTYGLNLIAEPYFEDYDLPEGTYYRCRVNEPDVVLGNIYTKVKVTNWDDFEKEWNGFSVDVTTDDSASALNDVYGSFIFVNNDTEEVVNERGDVLYNYNEEHR